MIHELIGCTTGVLYPHTSTKDALKILREQGVSTIEIGQDYLNPAMNIWKEFSEEDFAGFSHISIHAHVIQWGDNDDTKIVFERLAHLKTICAVERMVVHPDSVLDFSVFVPLGEVITFENMDHNKAAFQTPEEFEQVFEQVPEATMVLDVNHIFTNDKSMALADRFWERWGERINEVHVSGYSELHDPLVKTKQPEIVRAINHPKRKKNIPLIIESQLEEASQIQLEQEYIATILAT